MTPCTFPFFLLRFSCLSTPRTAVVPLPTGKMPGSWAAGTGRSAPAPAGARRPPGTWRTPLPVLLSFPADLPLRPCRHTCRAAPCCLAACSFIDPDPWPAGGVADGLTLTSDIMEGFLSVLLWVYTCQCKVKSP